MTVQKLSFFHMRQYKVYSILYIIYIYRRKSSSEIHRQTSKTNKDFQVGRDLIEDETSQENRVKIEIYIYYAKAVGMTLGKKKIKY